MIGGKKSETTVLGVVTIVVIVVVSVLYLIYSKFYDISELNGNVRVKDENTTDENKESLEELIIQFNVSINIKIEETNKILQSDDKMFSWSLLKLLNKKLEIDLNNTDKAIKLNLQFYMLKFIERSLPTTDHQVSYKPTYR